MTDGSVVVPPDDTVLVAVSLRGSAFLAWVERVLNAPPFFMQSGQVAIGRDIKRELDCQVNRIQVSLKQTNGQQEDAAHRVLARGR